MAFYGVNNRVRAMISGCETVGKLIDIDMINRQFKLETEHGTYWINQSQIIEKLL